MTEPTPPPPPTPPSDGAPPPPPAGSPPPASPPPAGGGFESENRTLMIVLSYLGFLALVPFFVEKEDQEVRWHAKHGLVLFGFEILLMIVFSIAGSIFSSITLGIGGCFVVLVGFVLFIGILVVHIMCIMKGIKGERLKLPVISDLPDQF